MNDEQWGRIDERTKRLQNDQQVTSGVLREVQSTQGEMRMADERHEETLARYQEVLASIQATLIEQRAINASLKETIALLEHQAKNNAKQIKLQWCVIVAILCTYFGMNGEVIFEGISKLLTFLF